MNRRLFLKLFGAGAAYPLWGWTTPLPAGDLETRPVTTLEINKPWSLEEANWPKISLVACGGAGILMTRNIDKSKYGLHEIIALETSKQSLIHATHADRTL